MGTTLESGTGFAWNSHVNSTSDGRSVSTIVWRNALIILNESTFLSCFSFIYLFMFVIHWYQIYQLDDMLVGVELSLLLFLFGVWLYLTSGTNFPLGFVHASSSFPVLRWRQKAQHGSVQHMVNYVTTCALAFLLSDNRPFTVFVAPTSYLFFFLNVGMGMRPNKLKQKIMFSNQNCLKLWLPFIFWCPSG